MDYVLERKRVKGQYLNYVSTTPHKGRKELHSYTTTNDRTTAHIFSSADKAMNFMKKYGYEAMFNCVAL